MKYSQSYHFRRLLPMHTYNWSCIRIVVIVILLFSNIHSFFLFVFPAYKWDYVQA